LVYNHTDTNFASRLANVILLPPEIKSIKSLDCFTKEVRNDRLKLAVTACQDTKKGNSGDRSLRDRLSQAIGAGPLVIK